MDRETFLTTLYVFVDDFCREHLAPVSHPGPRAALSRSEVLTLALFSRFELFRSDHDFYRWAQRHLRSAFPTLPHRTQWVRQMNRERAALEQLGVALAGRLRGPAGSFEALDLTAAPIRKSKRRGRGWLPGYAAYGMSREGWFYGFNVLLAVQPDGVITGWGFGPGNAKDQTLAEVFFAARHEVKCGRRPAVLDPERPGSKPLTLDSAGLPVTGVYLADKGFQGSMLHAHWRHKYGAEVWSPPQDERAKHPWPKGLRRLLASKRQIVETAIDKIKNHFGLRDERPHTLPGFACRLAARMAMHNYCIWMNRQLNHPNLAFVDLLEW